MVLVLQIAAGVVLGLFAFSILQVIFAWLVSELGDIWREMISTRWVRWTLGITGVGLYVIWLLGHPK